MAIIDMLRGLRRIREGLCTVEDFFFFFLFGIYLMILCIVIYLTILCIVIYLTILCIVCIYQP